MAKTQIYIEESNDENLQHDNEKYQMKLTYVTRSRKRDQVPKNFILQY